MAKWQEHPTRPPLPERARLLGDEMCQDAAWGTVEAGGRQEGYCCCPGIRASLSTRLWPALCPTRVPLLPVARLLPCVSGVALGPSQREAPSKVSWPQDLQLHSPALVLSQPCTPTQQKPRPRCFRRRRIEDKTHQIPGNRLTALNARLAAGTRVLEIRFRASGARAARSRDTQTRTRPDKRTDSASGERGPGLPRGTGSDESPGGGEPALHPRRDRAGGVPGGERGVPAPPPRELGGPAPPPPSGCLWVCPSVPGSAGLRAVPRRSPRAAQLFSVALCRALGAASASASSGPGAGAQSAGVRGPMALAPPPRPRLGRLPFGAPTVLSPSPPRSRPPCAPTPARGARLRPLDPRGRPTRALPPPPRRALGSASPDLRRPLGLSPRGSRSPSPSPSQSAPCRPPPLPGLSLACLCLSRSRSGLCLSLPPTLAAAPRAFGPRPPSPAPRPRPARPGAPAPAARGAPRTPNSRHPLRFARLSPLLTR
ncbi:hypothetical protein CapIbe_004325, partial [Capra ibex]